MTETALGQIEVEGERYGLTLVRRLAARIQDVWAAITEPEELEAWLSTTELEPRPGGRIQIDFGDNDVVRGSVRTFDPPHVFEFTWSLGELVSALLSAGMRLEHFKELPYANGWKGLADMREDAERRMRPPEHVPSIPLTFELVAVKP